MALATTATAFVTPGAAMTRKQRSNPASRLFMAADEIEKKESSQTATGSKSQPAFFFANQNSKTTVQPENEATKTNVEPQDQASKTTVEPETYREPKLSELVLPATNGGSKAVSVSGTAFDPFQVSSDGNQLDSVNPNGVVELKQEEDKQELGIWAARGILLLVAAIWGTNFAVRAQIVLSFFVSDQPVHNECSRSSRSHLFSISHSFLLSFVVNTTERQIHFRTLLSPAVQPSTVGSSLCSFRPRRLGQFSLASQTKQRCDFSRS
jgi:hypothetical protein